MLDQDSGHDPYKEFAKQTYISVETNIRDALGRSSKNEPVLVMVGEKHIDTRYEQQLNRRTPDHEHDPALAAAFTEIAALEAAAHLVGKDNIILSVEYNPENLPSYISKICDNDGVVPDRYKGLPLFHTLAYAINNDIEIAASDPGHYLRKTDPERREQMQRDSVAALASSQDGPRVVVHIGGSHHISNFSGYTNDEITSSGGHLTKESDPFDGIYSEAVFFNTVHMTRQYIDAYDFSPNSVSLSEETYVTNPINAIQIDAPGKMDESTADNISDMVRLAAQEFQKQSYITVGQENDGSSSFKFSGG